MENRHKGKGRKKNVNRCRLYFIKSYLCICIHEKYKRQEDDASNINRDNFLDIIQYFLYFPNSLQRIYILFIITKINQVLSGERGGCLTSFTLMCYYWKGRQSLMCVCNRENKSLILDKVLKKEKHTCI